MKYYGATVLICFVSFFSYELEQESSVDLPAFAYEKLVNIDHTIDTVLFAPHDALTIERVLIGLIRSTQTAISGAFFRLSNKKIIQELIEAHQRGVTIDIVLDPEALSTSQEISKLSNAGIPLSLYNHKKYGTFMHHKFLIFHHTLACSYNNNTHVPAIVAFGSLNFTQQGFHNQENISFRNKPEIVSAFIHEFDRLKKGTDCYILANTKSASTPTSQNKKHVLRSKLGPCARYIRKASHLLK